MLVDSQMDIFRRPSSDIQGRRTGYKPTGLARRSATCSAARKAGRDQHFQPIARGSTAEMSGLLSVAPRGSSVVYKLSLAGAESRGEAGA